MTIGTSGLRAVLVATAVTLVGVTGATVWAQSAQENVVNVPANAMSAGDIENRLSAQGIKVKEMELHDLLAEVEGYDAQGREIEVVLDRRSGEMLSHEYDR